MTNYPKAAEGLKLLFIAEIVSILGALLSLVPFVGVILLIVAQVLILLGLYKASGDDSGYQTAFIITIVNLVVSVIGIFAGGAFATILNVASAILDLAVVYYVVNTTGNLAHSMGNDVLSSKGKTVWGLYLACTIVSVIITLLSLIPLLGSLLAVALGVILLIVQLIAYILYLIFLNKASQDLM